ncbi:MAG: superoxide dismutase [Gemmataceae bacterium]
MHLNRRELIQAAGASVATLTLAPLAVRAEEEKAVGYKLPKLPYATDALEPSIDAKTMEIHHGKHHQAYITNANNLLKESPKLLALPVEELLADITKVPEKIRQGVINNAGGHANHTLFWEIMGPKGGEPTGALAKAIDEKFGSFDKFQKEMSTKAVTVFGSGWAWLVVNKKGELEVVQRKNQDSPLMDGLKPILGVDVWEHAYYLKYQNLRPKYVEAWWKVVNWKVVAEKAAQAMKG